MTDQEIQNTEYAINVPNDPVREILENACKATSSMIQNYTGKPTKIELAEYKFENTLVLYLKHNGDIMFKHIWELAPDQSIHQAREVMYGTLLTEMMSVFCVTVTEMSKSGLVDSEGKSRVKGR